MPFFVVLIIFLRSGFKEHFEISNNEKVKEGIREISCSYKK